MAGIKFPQKGLPPAELKSLLHDLKSNDMDWSNYRAFSMVFRAGDDVADVGVVGHLVPQVFSMARTVSLHEAYT